MGRGYKRGWRYLVRLAITVTLIGLLVALMGETLRSAARRALAHSWLIAPTLPLFLLWTLAAARGWQALFKPSGAEQQAPSLWRLTQIRVEAQALNLALPLSGIAGEVLKASTTARSRQGLWLSSTTVVLDGLASAVAGLLFSLGGISLHQVSPRLGPGLLWTLALLGALALLALFALPYLAALIAARSESALGQVAGALAQGGLPLRRALGYSVGWHFLERLLPALEIMIFARGLGQLLDLRSSIYVCAIMTGATLVFFFIPAQLGAAEGALALAFASLGMSERVGLEVALLRRLRQLLVAVVGLLLLAFAERGSARKPDPAQSP